MVRNATRRFSGAASDGSEQCAAPASPGTAGLMWRLNLSMRFQTAFVLSNVGCVVRDHPGAAVPSRGVSEAGWSRAVARRRGALIEVSVLGLSQRSTGSPPATRKVI